MVGRHPPALILNESNSDFIQAGVSIIASSRVDHNIPVIGRAVGCQISSDRKTIRLLFPTASTMRFLAGIRESGQIAVVFGRPSTHQTIQLKGADAKVVPSRKSDPRLAQQYVRAISDEVSLLGVDEEHVRAIVNLDPKNLTAVSFTSREAYVQTPGPRAGEPLMKRDDAHTR
jgi:hypothetical protein